MDLRSIINSDSSNAPPPRAALNREPSSNQTHHYLQQGHQVPYHAPLPAYPGGRHDTRPPQPPPLQPPPHRDIRSPTGSLSHQSTQSPYTNTPTSSLSGTQYPFPHHVNQSSAQGSQAAAYYPQRDRTTTIVAPGTQNYGQPSPSILTPTATTPGSSYGYSQHQRPQSSHSSMTPISAQSHVQNFPRDGPHAIQTHMINQLPRYSGQHYQSQPGTPLGPPPIIGRPSPSLHREGSSSYSYDHQRTQSGSSYGHPQGAIPSPIIEAPGPLASSPTSYDHRQPPSRRRSYLTDEDRERSLSVSPKTRLPSQTRVEPYEVTQEHSRIWTNGQVTPAKRKGIEHISEEKPPLTAHEPTQPYQPDDMDNGVMTGDIVSPSLEEQRTLKDLSHGQGQQRMNTLSPRIASTSVSNQYTKEGDWAVSQGIPNSIPQRMSNSGSLPATPLRQQSTTSQSYNAHQTPSSRISSKAPPGGNLTTPLTTLALAVQASTIKSDTTASPITISSPQQPARKRQRHEEPPIYARSVKANQGNPMLPNKRTPVNRGAMVKQEFIDAQIKGPTQTPPPLVIKDESNGHPPSGTEILLPRAQPTFDNDGPLGPWEPSILNLLPAEELTREICDFIFTEVVTRDDVGPGAVIEIEAKLGQLIDKNTNDRLRLPVATECILSKNDPNLRISFKSSMTESQHRTLNGYLNEALKTSLIKKPPTAPPLPASNPRIPMTYVHTRERDAFYELSQAGELSLPPSIRAQLSHRHNNKAKVRITTDQKTGRELAKIVKARVADLDVYSPRTPFDWRISVNLEMAFEGDMRDLVEVQEGQRRAKDRNKDRMTYRHLAYQIDLTQVTPAEATSHADKEHELEIEVSTAEVRKQGLLARDGQASQYEDLIRGFVDNVRVLARNCAG